MTNIEAALKYAEKGWSIFPCKIDKTPLTENGFKGATKDPSRSRDAVDGTSRCLDRFALRPR